MCCILNLTGQIFITINGVVRGVYVSLRTRQRERVRLFTWYNVVLDIIMIAGWVYDDQILLRALYEYSVSLYTKNQLKTRMATQREVAGMTGVTSPTGTNYVKMPANATTGGIPPPVENLHTEEEGEEDDEKKKKANEFPFSPPMKSLASRLFSLHESMHHTNRFPALFMVDILDPVAPVTPLGTGSDGDIVDASGKPPTAAANEYEPTFPSLQNNPSKSDFNINTPQLPPRRSNKLPVVTEEKNETSARFTEIKLGTPVEETNNNLPNVAGAVANNLLNDTANNNNNNNSNNNNNNNNSNNKNDNHFNRQHTNPRGDVYETDNEYDAELETEMNLPKHMMSPQTPLTHAGSEMHQIELMSELDLTGYDRARTEKQHVRFHLAQTQKKNPTHERRASDREEEKEPLSRTVTDTYRRYKPNQKGGVDLEFLMEITSALEKEITNIDREHHAEMSKVASIRQNPANPINPVNPVDPPATIANTVVSTTENIDAAKQ
ncbi:PHD zinc finger-containing protein [Reticulomyxa filosa]|uniref:PHD zinc finger-containing protein n=1 Tax=Reticulomyxa filosa TaxID=46433 RepID=X6MT55_RETFI|nr:PHD zinc finger-containing protein [Reticulomyxa filosa]|eukprot:ETO16637.1 PHD zinc finger-containing protein [Reticulomyxa filosa]